MKVRGIHLRGSKEVNDYHFDFLADNSDIPQIVALYGGNNAGKSFILKHIAQGWANCITGKDMPITDSHGLENKVDLFRVDFNLDNELCSLHVRHGKVQANASFANIAHIDANEQRHSVLHFDSSRINFLLEIDEYMGHWPIGVSSIFPILSDVHYGNVSNSVILLDDWDLGLDVSTAQEFFTHISRHAYSQDNQLILTSRGEPPSYLPQSSTYRLTGSGDAFKQAMSVCGRVAT